MVDLIDNPVQILFELFELNDIEYDKEYYKQLLEYCNELVENEFI